MNDRSASSLMVAVRPLVVLKYLGQLLLVLAALATVPLGASLAMGGSEADLRLGVVVGVMLAASLPLSRLPTPRQVQWNEALTVTALAFVIAPLAMTFPLMAYGMPAIDAWFEAVSGATTTGLSTLRTVEERSPLFLFSRAWMQWYGGLGIAVLSVALVMRHHPSSRRLLESTGEEAIAATASTHARRMFLVYLLLTGAGILLVWMTDGDLFVASIHALAAVSTGGFSGFDDSLAGLPGATRAAVMVVCVLGAIGLPLYYHARHDGPRALLQDPELRALLVAILASALLLGLLLHTIGGLSWGRALGQGALLGVSAQTTAGFSDMEIARLDPAAKLVLALDMLFGRVEIIALLVVLYPPTWIGRRRNAR